MTSSNEPLRGEVLSVATVCSVKIGAYDGRGAIRRFPTKVEVAYLGAAPVRLPCPITIDDEETVAYEAVTTRNAATTVVLVKPIRPE